ncbi:ScbA/BarX family gamma-butyrolactone biosynthesis protein [Streptomyces apocyni]|uniref:ScbA/BarX family gamma-butyrolactone biosynthesis protein n=1 Tax=Streptomyces apocyni TaxID=2654677 RepID=UPI0018D08445|nr:ScbA/BarX family gamma-butyrolactone biosynthesis protein [Streptomyces apocyni]
MSPSTGPSPTCIPQQYVHKFNEAEVLLTGWQPTGPDTHALTAAWPHDHPFYRSAHGLHDPLLLAESVRQAIPMLCHSAYDVPFGHRQIWQHFRFRLGQEAVADQGRPADLQLRIACGNIERRRARLSAMTMGIDLTGDGLLLGTAHVGFTNHPFALYRRMRAGRADPAGTARTALSPGEPVVPELVGRTRQRDVVLTSTDSEGRFLLRVDLGHPTLFDHPVDHVPGMLLLEAARQAANAVAHPRRTVLTAMDATFVRYVEFDSACSVEACVRPDDTTGALGVRVRAEQNGTSVFTASLKLRT